LSPEVDHYGRHSTGILPSHVLRRLIRARREIVAIGLSEQGFFALGHAQLIRGACAAVTPPN
jgi:hypothetical protein